MHALFGVGEVIFEARIEGFHQQAILVLFLEDVAVLRDKLQACLVVADLDLSEFPGDCRELYIFFIIIGLRDWLIHIRVRAGRLAFAVQTIQCMPGGAGVQHFHGFGLRLRRRLRLFLLLGDCRCIETVMDAITCDLLALFRFELSQSCQQLLL